MRLLAAKRAPRPDLFHGHLSYAIQGVQSYTGRPLPYPPDAVYCVCLEHRAGDLPARRQLVFVALHHDLHSADWILHEGAYEPFDVQLIVDLRALGCVAVLDA